ncbi:N-formylglutamate amidohydrolase [Phaeobacter sp. QD34_3]|uniref:N-formylglutamate amidohydrolase n=1 Tax=unclassified Phaeobacter TaxID=2621772 RepID=UPI00237F6A52|nr:MULTISPECIES: N-formylglutamate amidohydrolase [unclassified Phaeobacter]MDE4134859.1 N-formylglutamate amidohydrolase [Phaeobacter sp. QD34_3]MDE4138489.1 N-formylglutamate amidohydrolase [Phaeobacter sp. QD34_24]
MSPSDSNAQEEAVEVFNADGAGEVVILCEHASHHIPERYQGLGLAETDRTSHAAWDPGARAVSLDLAKALDAPMVASRISRLVYDCNRPPEASSAMPEQSEVIAIPGNVGLSPDAREERVQSVYTPFCTAVSQLLAARKAAGRDTLLVTMHSFTPVYFGAPRAVEIGILHDSDSRLADAMLAEAQRLPHRRIARNDPYGPEDGVTHSLQLHGIKHGLANVMIEVRNDLLRSAEDEARMAEELLTLLRPALAALQTERQADA